MGTSVSRRQFAGYGRAMVWSGLLALLGSGSSFPISAQEPDSKKPQPEWNYQPELLRPFWEGTLMQGESVLFIRKGEGELARAKVLFPIEEIVSVQNSDGDVTFERGRDYQFTPGSNEIVLPAGSRIPSSIPADLRRPAGSQKYRLTHRDGDGEIFFGGRLEYHALQTCITYRHQEGLWNGPVPRFDPARLPKSVHRLLNKQPLAMVVIGDSISAGCNASGWAGGAPYQPAYPELTRLHLEKRFGSKVTLVNPSVSGTDTVWVLNSIDKVVESQPDLVFIAFGMNDAAGRPAAEYQANIRKIIEKVREKRPECEFVLIAPMLGNRDWTTLKQELFPQYRDKLQELAGPGVAVSDLTSVWSEFLKVKQDWDQTGNGVNHPNDWGHRVYAQVLTTLLLPEVASASSGNRDEQQPATPVEPIEVPLWTGKPPLATDDSEGDRAKITVHIPKHPGGSAIVICPGGGYGGLVTGPEGHGIAKWLNSHGVTGVVLEYRLPAGRSAVPLLDAQRAIQTVRARAKEWHLNPSQVGIMGFSAGGHLASTVATHFDEQPQNPSDDAVAILSNRPDFAVLVYPVITMGQHTHGGSRNNLLGANPTAEQIELFSNEKQVTPRTPPVFVTHPIDDQVVPVIHSQQFYTALQAASVPAKYLELPSGGHGLNGYKGPMWDAWQTESLKWLSEQQLIELRKQ